jgi:hypothetical protein
LFSGDILSGNTLRLRMFAADSSVSYLTDSRSFSSVAGRPFLTIVAVPEPGAVSLGLAGAMMAFWRWSRKIPNPKLQNAKKSQTEIPKLISSPP